MIRLVDLPTPLQPAPRLADAIGLHADDLYIKRDDLIGIGLGGNKVRKLEFTLAEALTLGATRLITSGAQQSNHARLTAAAATRIGIPVTLVLSGDSPERFAGNLLLDRLFGAEVIFSSDTTATIRDIVNREEADGGTAYVLPFGGTNRAAVNGYRSVSTELLVQLPELRHAVVAAGSGGTMAGLVLGLGVDRVLGVDVGAMPNVRAAVADLVNDTLPGVRQAIRLDGTQIGLGYASLAEPVKKAMATAARTEALVLDPTYAGRAMAGLISAVERGDILAGEPTVFIHTGGSPGLFGHKETVDWLTRGL